MVRVPEQYRGSDAGGCLIESGFAAAATVDADTAQPIHIDTFEGLWCVLHTRARREKKVAETLALRGVDHFLPLMTSRRTYGKRVVEFSVPLFAGYVFLCGSDDDVQVARETNCLANVLPVRDQATLRADLNGIYRVVSSEQRLDLYPSLRRGRLCRVSAGPLKGVEGVVIRRKGVSRIFVALRFIGKSTVVEIDAAIVEAID